MNLEQFLVDEPETFCYTELVSNEIRKRIRVSMAAWAYEVLDNPFMSDAEYDMLAASIDLNISTNRPHLDAWFRQNFQKYTGSWVQRHPERNRIDELTKKVLKWKGML